MIKYKGIDWPAMITPELKARAEEASKTWGLPAAIATEIYQLGNDFKHGLLESFDRHQDAYPLMSSILDTHEASGYARIGYEILYFRGPHRLYIPVKEFLKYHLRNYEGLLDAEPQSMVAPWIDITSLMNRSLLGKLPTKEELNAAWEEQLTSIEADESIKSAQTVQRKSTLLSKNGPQALLEDLLRESEEIEEESIKRDNNTDLPKELEPLKFFNPNIHALRGIRAGIQRYEELYNYFSDVLLN